LGDCFAESKVMDAGTGREWFYRLGEEEVGPVTWSELRRLVDSGKISIRYEVRICRDSHAGQWYPISTIRHLLPELSEQTRSEAEVRLEQRVVSEVRHSDPTSQQSMASIHQQQTTASWGTAKSPQARWSWDPLFDTLAGASVYFAEQFGQLGFFLRRRAIPIAFVVALIGINAVLWSWATADSEQTQIEKVARIGRRYRELRNSRFDPITWSEFVQESKESLNEMIPLFQQRASVDRSIQQHLLWASKDCLMVMLDKPWGDGDKLEKEFSKHMAEIEYKLRRASEGWR